MYSVVEKGHQNERNGLGGEEAVDERLTEKEEVCWNDFFGSKREGWRRIFRREGD